MKKLISAGLVAFISFWAALTVHDYIKEYMVAKEASKAKAQAQERIRGESQAAEENVKKVIYSWKSDSKVNPVTGDQVATVTRFSGDIDGAITFRCYGRESKVFDILVSFPDDVEWQSGYMSGSQITLMDFRLDRGELNRLLVNRSSQKVASISDSKATKQQALDAPSLYAAPMAFKGIADATIFEASIGNGTIFDQTVSIDVSGIKEALKPVLSLCGKESI